jgi:hypothetical protein
MCILSTKYFRKPRKKSLLKKKKNFKNKLTTFSSSDSTLFSVGPEELANLADSYIAILVLADQIS